MKPFWFLAVMCGALAQPAAAQRVMRFSLPPEILDVTNCVANPGGVPLALGRANANLEVLDWATKAVGSNQPGEFVLKFRQPMMLGTLVHYGGGRVSVLASNEWRELPSGLDGSRKLQSTPFPFGELFDGIKVTVPGEKTNGLFQARLPFATLIPVRAVNVAGGAMVSSSLSAPGKRPATLVDGMVEPRETFSMAPRDAAITPEKPEHVTLAWPAPQRFRGLGFFRGTTDAGVGEPLIETFAGAGEPDAGTNGWNSILTRSTPPGSFGLNQFFVSMEMQETRGLRITATGGVSRLALAEIVVFQDLGAAPAPTNTVAPERKSYTIARIAPGAVKVDGKDDEWPAERIAGFALRHDDTNLYLVFRGKDAEATFENKGTNQFELFATGDALDLMLQARPGLTPGRLEPAPGDVRLVFAMFEGKPACVFYNYRVKDLFAQPVTFRSGEKTVWADKVEALAEAKIEVKRAEGEFTLEASVPLKSIHVVPEALAETRGDVGQIFSDASGAKAARRVHWSNRAAPPPGNLAEDAMVQPAHWGVFKFETAPEKASVKIPEQRPSDTPRP